MKDENRNTTIGFFLLLIVMIIIGWLLFIYNPIPLDEIVRVEEPVKQFDEKIEEQEDIEAIKKIMERQNIKITAQEEEIETQKKTVKNLNTKITEKDRELLMIRKKLLDRPIGSMIQKLDTSKKDQNLSNIKRKLKLFYKADYDLSPSDQNIVDHYDPSNDSVHPQLNDDNPQQKCIKLSEFGIKLLRNANKSDNDLSKYSGIISDIVSCVQKLIKSNRTIQKDEYSTEASTTLLSMYTLIYLHKPGSSDSNEEIIDKQTNHRLITKLIPKIPSIKSDNGSLLSERLDKGKYSSLLRLSTPRLLTNYINDTDAYLHDVNSDALYAFNCRINNDYCDHEMLDGIRQDGSAFSYHPERNVLHVDYNYYLKDVVGQIRYPDFYASVYSGLQIPGNYYDVIRKIVAILMHPKMDVLLHGLISSEGKVKLNFDWGDIKGKLGCYIIPSIGFGIFKTENLMFALRIQMSGIPTSCLKNCETDQRLKCNPFATSIMNIRKIHILEHSSDLKDFKNWDDVKLEAGIIKSQKNEMYMHLDDSAYAYSDCNNEYSISNYIGQLNLIDRVMFWKRVCWIHSAEDIDYKITEVGVFTSHGLEAIYRIHNLGSSPLLFRYAGTMQDVHYECPSAELDGCSFDGQDIVIPTGQPVSFKWYQFIESKHPVNLEYKEKKQTFDYDGHKYIVENIPDYEHQCFTVKRDTDDNIVLIGNNSIHVNDTITYEKINYYRDNTTMMYVRA